MYNYLKSALLLMLYAVVTIATSYKDSASSLTSSKSFSVSSNCSNASITSGLVSVLGSEIISPTGVTFQNLGFPLASVNLGQDVSGEIAPALIRNCVYSSTSVLGVTTSVYNCADNSIPACAIELTPH